MCGDTTPVYLRFNGGKEQVEALTRRIGRKVPKDGKIDFLSITHQQSAAMTSFRGGGRSEKPSKPTQLALFEGPDQNIRYPTFVP
jgi:CRISPR/Cas system-associated protein endoribonuclease Cas2